MSRFEIFDLPQDDQKKYIYRCSICQGEFKDAFVRDEHERKNLWRISFEKVEGDIDHIKCKHCGMVFVTGETSSFQTISALSKFKSHFTGTGSHCGRDVYLKWRFPPPKERKGKWTVHPIHEKLVAKHIKKDKEKIVLREHRNVTYLLIKALEYSFREEAWAVCQIVGPTGHGKSAAGIFLGQWICDYVEQHPDEFEDFTGRPELYITHSLFETADKFRTAKPYDTILQDESPNIQGRGQKWFTASLMTLMDTMRAAKVNLIFCTPNVVEELKTVQFIIEIYARWKTEMRTWGYLYDAERTALGEIFLDVSTTLKSKEYKEYVKRKMANIEALKLSGGSLSAQVSEERRNDDIDRVVRAVLSSEMISEDQLPKISLERVMGAATYVVDGIESYQKEISYYAQIMIQRQFKKSPEEESISRKETFKAENERKQQMEAEFYQLVIERECNSKATVRYASELFDWEKYRGRLFEKGSHWERVCRVIVDVVTERRLGELDEFDEEELEDEVGTTEPLTGRSGVLHLWNEYRTIEGEEALEVLRVIAEEAPNIRTRKKRKSGRWAFAKPKRLRELVIAAWSWYLYNGHDPPMKQQPARDETAEKFPREKVCNRSMMFRDAIRIGKSKRSEGWVPRWVRVALGYAGELAAKRLWFPNHIVNPDEHGPDLIDKTGQEAPVEVKVRMEYRDPNTENGERELFKRVGTYLNRILGERGALHMVQVNWRRGVCVVHFYALEYPEQ